jgi:hypothetical protein
MCFPLIAALILNGPPADGEAVIRAMHAAHSKTWFKNLTFVQKTSFPKNPVQWWYETMQTSPSEPAKLRLDQAGPDGAIAATTIYSGDSTYSFRGSVRGRVTPTGNPLLVLIAEPHTVNPDSTIAKLKRQGYNLALTYQSSVDGHKVTVVGAASAADSTTNQFWVDNDRLIVLRMITHLGRGVDDIHIGKHSTEGNALVERECDIFQAGELIQKEEYVWLRSDVSLEPGLFDGEHFLAPKWIDEYKKANGIPGKP